MLSNTNTRTTKCLISEVVNDLKSHLKVYLRGRSRSSIEATLVDRESERQLTSTISTSNVKYRDQTCRILLVGPQRSGNGKVMEQMNLSQYRRENLHLAHTEKNTGDAPHQSYLPLRRLRMNIIDVSGVRLSLRPKDWNELFDNTTSIIFVANLADYDQALENNPTRTRLDQSLEHFRVLVNSSRLKRASVILFLINQHEFEQNLTRSPLSCHFPGYGGGDNLMNATQYILGRFLDCNHAGLSTFAHVVEMDIALNFEVICAAIKETVLRNTLLNSKILHM